VSHNYHLGVKRALGRGGLGGSGSDYPHWWGAKNYQIQKRSLLFDYGAEGDMKPDFQDSRKSQFIKAMQAADEQQEAPVQPKPEAQVESERAAAATVLNSVFLREMQARFGKVERQVTAEDVTVEALKDAMLNARARQAA